MGKKAFLVLACILVAGPSDGWAQRIELTPFFGYRFAESFDIALQNQAGEFIAGDFDFKNTVHLGLIADIALSTRWRDWHVEVFFDRQATELRQKKQAPSSVAFSPFDVTIDQYQAGFLYQRYPGQVRPFGAITFGIANLRASGGRGSETRFAWGTAVGAKVFLNERIGLRLQSRLSFIYVGDSEDVFCDEESCFAFEEDLYYTMLQFDVSGGLVIAL